MYLVPSQTCENSQQLLTFERVLKMHPRFAVRIFIKFQVFLPDIRKVLGSVHARNIKLQKNKKKLQEKYKKKL